MTGSVEKKPVQWRFETVPPDEDDSRLDRFLRRLVPGLAQGSIERMLRNGLIRVDGGKAKANIRLLAGQIVRLPPDLQPVAEKKSPGSPKIVASSSLRQQFDDMFLAEGRGWLAINKPSGLAVQGGTSIATHVDGMLQALASRSDSQVAAGASHRQGYKRCVAACQNPRVSARLDRGVSATPYRKNLSGDCHGVAAGTWQDPCPA
jgi:23S rRNA-/tRNA-specific pseudouridylate synthase